MASSTDKILLATVSASSPTVNELLQASNWEYLQTGTPADLISTGGTETITADGFSGTAWLTPKGAVVISYEGTQLIDIGQVFSNFSFTLAELETDINNAYAVNIGSAETDALSFAQTVIADAAKMGISESNVYVTGHSLGGIEAEYVAQQTGLAGIAFESTGLPYSAADSTAQGADFVNTVTYGDPVANYASDVEGEQPYSPKYVAGPSGAAPHYGQLLFLGSTSAQTQLQAIGATYQGPINSSGSNTVQVLEFALGLFGALVSYHLPATQAADLGVTLQNTSIEYALANTSGPSLNVGGDTLQQLLSYMAAHPSSTGVGSQFTPGYASANAALVAAAKTV